MTDEEHKCPVCGKDCSNPGGLAAHLEFTKDTDHEAHRAGATAPTTAPFGGPSAPTASVVSSPPPAVVPGPPAPTSGPTAAQPGASPVVEFVLPAPTHVQPLLMEGANGGPTTGAINGAKPPPVVVPFEPIIGGATAVMLNGFFLRAPKDGKLTPDMVGATGFPRAVDACLRHYFPGLNLDHPVTALIASGAALAILVASLKAPKDEAAKKAEAALVAPTEEAPAAPMAASKSDGKTGDPYWDAILAQAGGAASDDA